MKTSTYPGLGGGGGGPRTVKSLIEQREAETKGTLCWLVNEPSVLG